MSYSVTRHAYERYAQRIMGKNNKTDIAVFISNQIDKMESDINKMIEYGEVIYEGKSIVDYNKQPVQIVLNGTWVLVIDKKNSTVITLYTIDLGVGKEFNEQYIGKLKSALDEAKGRYNEKVEEIDNRVKEFKNIISDNEKQIKEFSSIINSLKDQNKMYEELIEETETSKMIAEQEVREIVATLTGKSVF